ncbi:glucose-6-phosphate dehydrogenase (coenzyme-F420) [Actinomadura fulvescens]|uniref:glucose-6-phosphate dehydrogenase (coenzyme-F420) n=1 Tax=Actinomadura fulvescens TaxID=46160 RepID=UPI0031CE806E
MPAVKLGYKASSEQFGPDELLGYGLMAERYGFDSVFLSDHLQPWRHDGGHAPAVLPMLGALGARTERIVIGTSVLTPTFRYHPAVVAQAFATLGSLFPGRVVLGLGSGEAMNEAPLGIAWPNGKERLARLREAVDLIRALWRDERVTFEGDYYRTVNATIYDRPEKEVPIWLAASGPAATRFAGRTGDGWITTSGKDAALYTDVLLPAVATGAAAAGRAPERLEKMIEVKVSFDPDRDRALAATRFWAALGLGADQKAGIEDPVELQRLADRLPLEDAARRFIVSTDPDEHVQQIKSYVDLGFNHLVFHSPGPDQAQFFELYGREILPRLRDSFSPHGRSSWV